MAEKRASKKDDRARVWTFVMYPDSAPQNWRELIDEEHVPWVESPIHDKCKNPDGTNKKLHWHVVVMYEGKKSFEQIKMITDKLNAPIPQKVASVSGVIRYMAHMDNPEKTQYNVKEIIGHGGADIARYLKATAGERHQLIKEMMEFVNDNDIIEYCDLACYAMINRFEDWFPLLCDNSTYFMGQYIKSRRHRMQMMEKQ